MPPKYWEQSMKSRKCLSDEQRYAIHKFLLTNKDHYTKTNASYRSVASEATSTLGFTCSPEQISTIALRSKAGWKTKRKYEPKIVTTRGATVLAQALVGMANELGYKLPNEVHKLIREDPAAKDWQQFS